MSAGGYWKDAMRRVLSFRSGLFGAIVFSLFIFVALYAPLLASSKPLFLIYDGTWYMPLFRYYFSASFFSKGIDLFFNIVGAVFPFALIGCLLFKRARPVVVTTALFLVPLLFVLFSCVVTVDPANNKELVVEREKALASWQQKPRSGRYPFPLFSFDLHYMNDYQRLNMIVDAMNTKARHDTIIQAIDGLAAEKEPYTLYSVQKSREEEKIEQLQERIKKGKAEGRKDLEFEELQNRLQYIHDKRAWIEKEQKKVRYLFMPLIRPLHWQDDAGGDQALNLQLPFMELSRLNRQDLLGAILFGVRISCFVGFFAVLLELIIGIPLGLVSGYFAGRLDIFLSRFVEIWESMPAFFMLLLIVSLLQTKSLFLIITVIALFSWTSTFRFVRAEALRQREIPYIEACQAIGFPSRRILFSHILPNAIVPVVALLPFDIMSAITREAGLSFLGLGEELTCSWGQLMEEGASAFPAESALLWPPAIALSLLLIAIAFIGDALMRALNPKEA